MKKILEYYARLSKREKFVLFATLVVVLFFLGDRLVIEPVGRKMALVDQQIRDEETGIRKSLHVLKQEGRVKAESRELAAYSVASENPEAEMTGLLKEIENLANQSSVSLVYVRPAASREGESNKKYYANLECEAQMEQIAGFFYALETSPRLLKVEKFEIQPKAKESSIARCSITVSKTIL